jgi:hypothetical protein
MGYTWMEESQANELIGEIRNLQEVLATVRTRLVEGLHEVTLAVVKVADSLHGLQTEVVILQETVRDTAPGSSLAHKKG